MTVLAACQQASKLRGRIPAPTTIYATTTDQYAIELSAICNEVAQMMAKVHDWRVLTTLHTLAGTGSATAFSLPSDYDRMPVKSEVFSTDNNAPLCRAPDLDEWLRINLENFTAPSGWWILLGGQMQIVPALASGTSAKFYYISNLIVMPSAGANKVAFTADTDTFRLNERVLGLGAIYKWLQMKGYDYAEEMRDYELALAQEIARDKGSRSIAIGRARIPSDVQIAYPGTLSA